MSHIVIDEDRCKGCELCTTVCPQGNLVQMANHFNVKGYRPSVFVDPEDSVHRLYAVCHDVSGHGDHRVPDTQKEAATVTHGNRHSDHEHALSRACP